MASKIKLSNANGKIVTIENNDSNMSDVTLNGASITKKVDTLANMRAMNELPETIWCSGYHSKNDGAFGSHFYRLKGLRTTELDNSGTLIVVNVGGSDYVYELQFSGAVNVKWFGAIGDGINDTTALKLVASYDYLLNIHFPSGIYVIDETIKFNRAVKISGDIKDSSMIKASSIFAGINMFELGYKDVSLVVLGLVLSDINFNCNGKDIAGLGCYGLRDGSTISNVRVYNSIGTHIRTGLSNGVGSLMNQGLIFNNVHAITTGYSQSTNTYGWCLDGLFESTLFGCKYLGGAGSDSYGITGFGIGINQDSKGVLLQGCSAGNIRTTNLTFPDTCAGIHYGQYAESCRDNNVTFENISGYYIKFDGSNISGVHQPYDCISTDARFYLSAGAGDLARNFTVFVGNSVRFCKANLRVENPYKKIVFDGTNQSSNSFVIYGSETLSAALTGGRISIVNSSITNHIEYINTNYLSPSTTMFYTGESGIADNLNSIIQNNGQIDRYTRYDTIHKLPTVGAIKYQNKAGVAAFQIGDAAVDTFGAGVLKLRVDQFYTTSFQTIRANTDNTLPLGTAANRWSTVYAGTGTINTSDDREKTYLDITDIEKQVAKELQATMKKFKFNNSIEEKGINKARIHYGTSAQSVKATFEKYGLVAEDYAILCHDEWEAEYEQVTDTEAEIDKDGNVIKEATYKEVLTREAGDRYGIRYEELLCFIISAL